MMRIFYPTHMLFRDLNIQLRHIAQFAPIAARQRQRAAA
jgi:hypothetical protein